MSVHIFVLLAAVLVSCAASFKVGVGIGAKREEKSVEQCTDGDAPAFEFEGHVKELEAMSGRNRIEFSYGKEWWEKMSINGGYEQPLLGKKAVVKVYWI